MSAGVELLIVQRARISVNREKGTTHIRLRLLTLDEVAGLDLDALQDVLNENRDRIVRAATAGTAAAAPA